MIVKPEPRVHRDEARLVFVVDDQPSALKAVVFLIRTLGPEWEVTGFSNPLDALTAVKATPPDLVLSDFNMPELMGGDLLEEVRAAAPNAVRMVMSGWIDLNKLSKITSAHQYFAKPFDSIKLKELIRRTFAARESIEDPQLRELVVSLRSLPSLPDVYHTLLEKLDDEGGSSDAIAGMIAKDPGISSKLLHLANSSLFGRASLVTDPFDAVLCLGTELIKAVVLSQELARQYANFSHPELDLPKLWSHSWDVAELAQYICRQKRVPRSVGEEAFLAGLLHEVGMLILVENFPDQFKNACDAAKRKKTPLNAELLQTLRASPAQVGSYLLELWGMPSSVTRAVYFQEHPEREGEKRFSITTALYIANQIASRKVSPSDFVLPDWNIEYLQAVDCWNAIPSWEQT
jgi:HD-like signal output (HDOD) protein